MMIGGWKITPVKIIVVFVVAVAATTMTMNLKLWTAVVMLQMVATVHQQTMKKLSLLRWIEPTKCCRLYPACGEVVNACDCGSHIRGFDSLLADKFGD